MCVILCHSFLLQPYDSLPTSQTCFFQLRLPPYSSQSVMAERLRYAINNCRSIDMDNYMLSRNVDNAEGSDTDYWPPKHTQAHGLCLGFGAGFYDFYDSKTFSRKHLKHIIQCFYFHILFLAEHEWGVQFVYTQHTDVCFFFLFRHYFLALPFFRIFCMKLIPFRICIE